MIFIIKKVGKEYRVKNRFTNRTRGIRTSNSEAQRLAAQLERDQRRVGCEHVMVRGEGAR